MGMDTRDGITTVEAARIIGITRQQAHRLAVQWTENGQAEKIGRDYIMDRDAVEAYAAKPQTGPGRPRSATTKVEEAA